MNAQLAQCVKVLRSCDPPQKSLLGSIQFSSRHFKDKTTPAKITKLFEWYLHGDSCVWALTRANICDPHTAGPAMPLCRSCRHYIGYIYISAISKAGGSEILMYGFHTSNNATILMFLNSLVPYKRLNGCNVKYNHTVLYVICIRIIPFMYWKKKRFMK